MTAPVVFLDIDGVLNTIFTWGRRPHAAALEPARVARINTLCAETGAVVVVTSTWRRLFELDDLRALLAGAGLTAPIVGVTPCLDTGHRRDEIRFWVNSRPEPPARFVIFDDDETAGIAGHFVWIARSRGVEDWHIDRAREVLGAAAMR